MLFQVGPPKRREDHLEKLLETQQKRIAELERADARKAARLQHLEKLEAQQNHPPQPAPC